MKNTQEQQEKGEDLVKILIEKAWENPEFKEQLINNPSKTISNFLGKELENKMPNGVELLVVDQTDESKFYLNIPAKPKLDLVLSEEQLDQVAGGTVVFDAGKWCGEKVIEFYNWATS
jgi:hypothetical protein